MHSIRRDTIPPRSSAPAPKQDLSNYGDRKNNKDYGGMLRRFLQSDAIVWEIIYDTTTHTAYSVAESFNQAAQREGLRPAVTVACRGARVFLARPEWQKMTPPRHTDAPMDKASKAARQRMIERALLEFVGSGWPEAVIAGSIGQTALYHALHYTRTRLMLSVTISRDERGIVLTPRGA